MRSLFLVSPSDFPKTKGIPLEQMKRTLGIE